MYQESRLAKTCERVVMEYSPSDLNNLIKGRQAFVDNPSFDFEEDQEFTMPDCSEELSEDVELLLEKVCSEKPDHFLMPAQGSIPDDVKTLLHAAYFYRLADSDEGPGYVTEDYLEVLRSEENLTKKALVYSLVESVFKASMPSENARKERAIEPLAELLRTRHGSIESAVYELPDDYALHENTYHAFMDYAKEIKVGAVMPDYQEKLKNITKGDFVNVLALKFFYDSMRHARNKKQGRVKSIRKLDNQVDAVCRAAMNHLGIKARENYLPALKEFVFDIPDFIFMSPAVHNKFVSLIPD